MSLPLLAFRPGERVERARIPRLSTGDFREAILDATGRGSVLVALFGVPDGDRIARLAVLGDEGGGRLLAAMAEPCSEYLSLTPDCPAAHLFERELFELHGVRPLGHPWLKPVRYVRAPGAASAPEPAVGEFFRVEGEEIHEVAVGPVHAGVIEPGHFRFQCLGEEVLHLEIALGFQHRGVERALAGGPGPRTGAIMETIAGDTTIGHMTAHAEAVEALAGVSVSVRAQVVRAIALELERLANHTGDLGALANDVGFLPTAAYCGRLRGDFLNLSALGCGSRFGRGWIRPGGVQHDFEPSRAETLVTRLDAIERDVTSAVTLLWETPSVMARFEDTGALTAIQAYELGLVGPAARACGVEHDTRQDFPTGFYRFAGMPVSSMTSGDVFARAYVRWLEMQRSMAFIRETAKTVPPGRTLAAPGPLAPDSLAVGLVEGWRGRIAHAVLTDAAGRFEVCKIVDPSFFNWTGLALALRNQAISDFPLCNKSFNLSYCGHDL